MKSVTEEMIRQYKIMKLGYDFMGYEVSQKKYLSFHHLIIPRRNCTRLGLGDGYYKWNGAILVQETSHEYLHIIENKDYDMFLAITSEMIDENVKGRIDKDNLLKIRDILLQFEKEHINDKTRKGKKIIKEDYLTRRLKLNL